MSNTNFHLPVLIILLALTLFLIRAQGHSFSELSTLSSSATDMPDIARSFLAKKFRRPQSLKNRLDFLKMKTDYRSKKNNKKVLHSQKYSWTASHNIITEPIIYGTQYKFVIVNETAVITASDNFQSFTLNLINLVNKSKIFQVFSNIEVGANQLAMKLFDQSTLFVYIKDRFLVVNVANLAIRQTILFSEQPKVSNDYGDIFKIENYVKNESGVVQKTVVLGYQGVIAQVLEYNYQTNQYALVNQAFKPLGDFYLNSPNSGVSFWNSYRVPYLDLRQKYRIFEKQIPIKCQRGSVNVISNSEQVVATASQGSYYFYQIKINFLNKSSYQLTERYTVELHPHLSCTDKIRFTDDGKYLFVNLKQVYERYYTVGVLDVGTGVMKYFDYDGESFSGTRCFDYGIVDSAKFVIVCEGVKGEKNGVRSYQLRLYELNNFKLIDVYSIDVEATNMQIKTNPNFNSNLILQIFNNPNQFSPQPPTLKLFKIVNKKLILSSIPPTITNLTIVTDCLSYLVGTFNNQPYHSFININTFSTVKKTPRYDLSDRYDTYGPKDYFVQDNILGICNHKYYFYKCEMYQFYDLAKIGATGEQWRLCYFFMETSMNFNFYLHQEQRVVTLSVKNRAGLLKRSICKNAQPRPQPTSRSHSYNNNRPKECCTNVPNHAIQLISCTPTTQSSHSKTANPQPHPPKPQSGSSANTNTQSSTTFPQLSIMLSSNNKYLILLICSINPDSPSNCLFRYDVRSVDDLEVSLYKTAVIRCYVQKEENCLADVTEKGELVYLTQDGLFLENMGKKEGYLRKEINEATRMSVK